MNITAYENAKLIISQNPSVADFVGGCSDEALKKAEVLLGVELSDQYKDFLSTFGAGNFGAQEIFGIINDDFEKSSVPDGIWYTLTEREESNLPRDLLIIYDTGAGELYCLKYLDSHLNKEPIVVNYFPGYSLQNQPYKIIANDFGELLQMLVKEELE
ncbi:SMI1/KNR4 family protein [Shouchella patagoniensis]|uniref:SMI1/KNR4 family protein n=1 Tax=Shouchella patagoniensis TaxID=228576 RepID=UPI000995C360|nr:SMI1/KNR4 family protein [Shouchella patagoniensis]